MAAIIISTVTSCNKAKDKCEGVVCQNSGTCVAGVCDCPPGYSGTHCETKANTRFVGDYTGSANCGGSPDPASFPIEALNDPLSIQIDIESGHYLEATVNGDAITIPVQNFPSGSENYRFSGNGTLNGNVLTLTIYVLYSSVDPDLYYTCTYSCSKQ